MPEIKTSSPQDTREDLDYLRQRIQSLAFRGDFPGCVKMIDDNMRALYEKERWPDRFFSILTLYQRCYPSLQKSESLENRLASLFKKNDIPFVLATFLRGSGPPPTWNADYFKDLAVLSESAGNYEIALSYCDLAIKIDPAGSGLYVVKGWILDDLERPSEAEAMYRYALELSDANHNAHYSLAKHYTGKYPKKALEHIEKAIALAPSEGSYYDAKARILTRLDDRDGAVFCYDLAMSAAPYVADYPYQKGELLLMDGKEVAAIAQFRKAVSLDEKHAPSLLRLANLYAESRPELALGYLNSLAALEPEDQSVLLLRASLLGKLGETAAALDEFRQLLGMDPRSHEALAGYADTILNSDPRAAIPYYEKAIAISPKTAAYHIGKAMAHEKLGQTAQAIKEYRAAISLDKKNARAYGRLGALLAESKPREAADCYTKAVELDPGNAWYYIAKAEILMKIPGGRNGAIDCLNRAAMYDPGNGELHKLLAGLLEESGNAAAAAAHYRQAVGTGTDDPDAFYRLAKLTFDSSPENALLHINSAISLDGENGEYYYLKAKILTKLGHDPSALGQLQESLRADGRNAAALGEISELISSDNPELALFYINRAVALSPGNPDYICARGNLMYDSGNYPGAFAQYGEALRLDRKNPGALFGTARCLALSGGNALEYFDKAIAIVPGAAEYHAGKASFLASNHNISEAIASYDAAIALDGQNWSYPLEKAKLLEVSGQPSAALTYYRSVVSVYPGCPEAVGRLGILLAESSPSEALLYLDNAIELEPQNYLYHAWKSRVLLALGDNVSAAREYQKSASVGGETAETCFTLAGILAEHVPEVALGYCLRAIKADNRVADYHFLCGRLYIVLGQTMSAIERFHSVAALDPSRHDAREKVAKIMYESNDSRTLEAINYALENSPDCPSCLFMRAKLMDAQEEDRDDDSIIAILDRALKASPDFAPAREMLIELLKRKRSFVRLALEKRKLNKGNR